MPLLCKLVQHPYGKSRAKVPAPTMDMLKRKDKLIRTNTFKQISRCTFHKSSIYICIIVVHRKDHYPGIQVKGFQFFQQRKQIELWHIDISKDYIDLLIL
ncbi:hypothetical protein D3C87_1644210 [compost metagenome]